MRKLATILLVSLLATPVLAHGNKSETKLLREAEQVLASSVKAPDKGIPKDLLEKAECVGVFPGVTKAAFVVGGEFGRGVFTCRDEHGKMGAPAFFTIGGGSVGWQIGGQQADLVLLIMNENGVKHLLQDKFTVGGEVSAVAGPVGRTAQAATDSQLHAQILSWSRARGVFLGASLKGTAIRPNKEAIAAVYGKKLTAGSILLEQAVAVPNVARSFVERTNDLARRS
jgi:SH3 domain-containing YSC84-like protein 1